MSDKSPIAEQDNSEADTLLQKAEFGAELKAARESAGLSVEDIADSILISADIIRAIDNSRSDELPSATFTQGYIRSYSRILGISADKTIEAYNLSLPDAKQINTPVSVLPVNTVNAKGSHNSLYFIIAIIFIVGACYWVYNNLLQNQVVGVLDKVAIITDKEDDNKQQLVVSDQASESLNNQLEEQAYFTEPEILDESAGEVIESQVPTEKEAVINKPAEKADSTNMTLVITASEDSWCEINDSESRLLYRLVKSGETLEIQGKPPYRIFLGNARKVSILLNQREINFDQLIRPTSKVVNLSLNAQAEVSRYINN